MTAVRWSAGLTVNWTPILTFARRRVELLDWFEQHIALTGFSEDATHIEIAIHDTQRLRVRRNGLEIHLVGPDDDGSELTESLTGVLNGLEPKNATMATYVSAWSAELPSEYDDARRSLASKAMGLEETGDFLPIDCSVLTDLVLDNSFIKCEFGIVDGDELVERVEDPHFGRMASLELAPIRPEALDVPDELPAVSLFADLVMVPFARPELPSGEAIVAAMAACEATASRLLEALEAGL